MPDARNDALNDAFDDDLRDELRDPAPVAPPEDLRETAARLARNVELVLRGDYDDIDEATQRDLATFLRDHLEGRSRVEIRLSDRITVEGRRDRDGTVMGSLKIDF